MAKAQTTAGHRSTVTDGLLARILNELLKRMEKAPLMRRPAALCSPEEREQLITLIRTLSTVQNSQDALPSIPDIEMSIVEDVWPELAAVIGPAKPRDSRRPTPTVARTAPNSSTVTEASSSLFPLTDEAPAPPAKVAEQTIDRAAEPPTTSMPHSLDSRRLRDTVRGIMRTDSQPWSAARLTSMVQEKHPAVTSEEVYNTLRSFHELFEKRSRGWHLTSVD